SEESRRAHFLRPRDAPHERWGQAVVARRIATVSSTPGNLRIATGWEPVPARSELPVEVWHGKGPGLPCGPWPTSKPSGTHTRSFPRNRSGAGWFESKTWFNPQLRVFRFLCAPFLSP